MGLPRSGQRDILCLLFSQERKVSINVKDPRLSEIIDVGTASETLADGFKFVEGPIWHPGRQDLIFSDIPADRLYRWNATEGVTLYREPSHMANGNTYDRAGRILTCEHATSRVVREADDGLHVLASQYEGKELNSPNDIVVARDGGIYFTDPTYGRSAHTGVERQQELDFQGVYRIDPTTSRLQLLGRDFAQPNGLCFNLDETVLYVADTTRRHILRFRVEDDGSITAGEPFAESPAPDGLKVDSLGNVYAGGPGGVHVYHRDDGAWLGVIGTPGFCANFTWGGVDMRDLFMTASNALYRIRVQVAGVPLF
jgi:gluconolactonase